MVIDGQQLSNSLSKEEYDLKVDEQVGKFLDLHHNLTFFLVTAAVGSLAFTITYATSNDVDIGERIFAFLLILAASTAALSAAGSALVALNADIRSFRFHLRYRYERKNYDDVSDTDKAKWDRANKLAAEGRKWAFVLLFLSVGLQVMFLVLSLFDVKGGVTMHHFGEDSTRVVATETGFDFFFENKETGQVITMHVPREGTLSDPTRILEVGQATDLAYDIAHFLRDEFD